MKSSRNKQINAIETSVTTYTVLYLRPQPGEGRLGETLRSEGFSVHYLRRPTALQAACTAPHYQVLIVASDDPQLLANLPARVRPRVCLRIGEDAGGGEATAITLSSGMEPVEIVARLRALLRRAGGYPPQYRVGPLGVDVLRGRASLAGRTLRLPPGELRALMLLARSPGAPVANAQLAAALRPGGVACASLVPTYIARLRRRLGRRFIQTLPGIGYRLTPPEQVS